MSGLFERGGRSRVENFRGLSVGGSRARGQEDFGALRVACVPVDEFTVDRAPLAVTAELANAELDGLVARIGKLEIAAATNNRLQRARSCGADHAVFERSVAGC